VKKYKEWDNVSKQEKRKVVDRERRKVFRYENWQQINKKLFGGGPLSKLRKPQGREVDGFSTNGMNYGGSAESKEHKKLKEWVATHPQKLGLRKSFGKGVSESPLLSGDTIDVLFSDGNEYVAVEVKSCRSNDEDFRRGIYQCVKYRKVKEAEHLPNNVSVRALLVTERELNAELRGRARLLEVSLNCLPINKKK